MGKITQQCQAEHRRSLISWFDRLTMTRAAIVFILLASLFVNPTYASPPIPYKIQGDPGMVRQAHHDTAAHHDTPAHHDTADSTQLAWCENAIARTLAVLPTEHVQAIHSLTLSFDPTLRRGLAGGNTLIIRCVNISEKELVAVLVHEVGHVVDTGLLHASSSDKKTSFADRGQTVYSTDPSVRLYAVSWEDNRSFTGQNGDVVSGYSLSNPYEEFAETYALYVLHGRLFKAYAESNLKLDQKYRFMKNGVFDGKEYDLGDEPLPQSNEVNRRAHRAYDVTRMDFNLESFWAPLAKEGSVDSKLSS